MCDCITTINLATGKEYPKLVVNKIETRKRGSVPLMVPTYCPFCGTPYERQPAVPENEGITVPALPVHEGG